LSFSQVALAAVAAIPRAHAQDAETEKAIEKYRQMLREDPWSNPGYLDADRGEALWTTLPDRRTQASSNAISARGRARSTARSPSCRAISPTRIA
jgi:hypothetical protein